MNKHPCPHFTHCSGCETGLDTPPPIWEAALSFFKKFSIAPALHLSSGRGWRMKAKLAVQGNPPKIGLYKRRTHEVSSIPHCLVHHPSINQAVLYVQQALAESNLSIYEEKTQKGALRYLQFFVERETGRVQLVLVVNAPSLDSSLQSFCRHLEKFPLWHSIWINFHPQATNRILGSAWQRVSGEEWLRQKMGDMSVAFHPGAFAQAHLELFEKMLITIKKWVPDQSRILELFAGLGLIGRSLEPTCKSLTLVENNPLAELSYCASYPESEKCHYLLQDATQVQDFSPYDIVIVDPPRKGLSEALLLNLCRAEALRLIYVSCGWDSFQRDCEWLTASGWQLKEAEGFLLFPGTDHVETVALFDKP